MSESTREPQYNILLNLRDKYGLANFGLMSSQVWGEDPKRILFLLARYKFVSKMLSGRHKVLEVGCADAFGSRLVQQTTDNVTAVDFDRLFIEDAKSRIDPRWPIDLRIHDMLSGPVEPCDFDGLYSMDVLEHIEQRFENVFMENVSGSLNKNGVAVIGCPSLESQTYASPQSKEGHVNCKTGEDFRILMEKHFHNVFLFSMNDEVVHTGFVKMAHYLIAICCGKRSPL